MATRRSFVKTGLALPAASWAAGAVFPLGASAAQSGVLELERFIYDARFAEAFDVAQHAASRGVELAPIADDLMDLWYDDLDLRWKQAPMALAGVTMREALFVLDTLATDRGMRVVYRGEHGVVEDGKIVHKLAGPAEMIEPLSSLPEESAWEARLSLAMAGCPLGKPDVAETEFVTSVRGLPLRDVPLYSWIIAPRSAVALTIKG